MNIGVAGSNFGFENHVGIRCLLLLGALIGSDDLILAVSCCRKSDWLWVGAFFLFFL